MRRILLGVVLWLLLCVAFHVARAGAQICNPVCANQPNQCCMNVQADTFLAEECTGATSDLIHFVLTNGTAWVDKRTPAQFDVSGLHGTVTLGDVMPVQIPFVIGRSFDSARFQIILDSLPVTIIGQCVGTSGNVYTGLPSLVSVAGRALSVSGRNPLFCRATGFPDLLCFSVKGNVGGPFAAGALCDPDRVEYACGTIS